jgi:hypothetical protein
MVYLASARYLLTKSLKKRKRRGKRCSIQKNGNSKEWVSLTSLIVEGDPRVILQRNSRMSYREIQCPYHQTLPHLRDTDLSLVLKMSLSRN